MEIFIAWSVILCIVILNLHISSNETKNVLEDIEEVYHSERVGVGKKQKGLMITEELDIKQGKRQTVIGLFSIIVLMFMFLLKPFILNYVNIIVFVFNGLIITSLIGYMIEGVMIWNFPEYSSEDEEG